MLTDCVFQGSGPFHLGYQISGHRIIYGIPLLPIEWPPNVKSLFIGKDPDAGKD